MFTVTALANDCGMPSVSISYQYDEVGDGTAQVTYSFPTGGHGNYVQLWHEGTILTTVQPTDASGTFPYPMSVRCWRPGTHTVDAIAVSCGNWADNAYVGRSSATVTIETQTANGATYTPDDQGNGTFSSSYTFPFQSPDSYVQLWVDGQVQRTENPATRSGSWSFPLSSTCWAPGTHRLDMIAVYCGRWGDPAYVAKASTTVDIGQLSVTASAAGTTPAGVTSVAVTYKFPSTADASQRVLTAEWLPSQTSGGGLIGSLNAPAVNGQWSFDVTAGSSNEMVKVTATRCGAQQKVAVVMIPAADRSCSMQCPSCVGRPVRVSNGNMRYVERDLLPGEGAERVRTYDSTVTRSGAFGVGWTSVFDAWLATGSGAVVIATEGNDRVVFNGANGTYVQVWPAGLTSRGRLTLSGGTYLYREGGTDLVRGYRASDGRLVSLRKVSNSREVDFTYDASGLPQSAADANGAWQWLIVTDATSRRIQSISVTGRPDIVWTYVYDVTGNLTGVTAPDGQPWRAYSYASGVMVSAFDGAGRLIESHTYTSGHATSSIAATNSVTGIQYDLPGRVAGETYTQVTSATGLASKYYIRWVGGRATTVQVVGGCASCGTDDAVYGFDAYGHVLREQDGRGFVTVRQYDDTGSYVTLVSGPWAPAGCDPTTDPSHCRLTADNILSTSLVATSATRSTTYANSDSNWPDRATTITSNSVLGGSAALRTETYSYDAATGVALSSSVTGWTGTPAHQETRTTTTTLYDGVAAAAFDPCAGATSCAFSSSWLTLAQPAGLSRTIDGPRADVTDVSTYVYYPIDSSVPAPNRGRLAAVKNAAGLITRYENYDVFGKALTAVDANGAVTQLVSDAAGRVTSTSVKAIAGCDTSADPLCGTDLVNTAVYGAGAGPLASSTRPAGGTTTYEYDDRARLIATTRRLGTSSYERLEQTYDAATGLKMSDKYLDGVPGTWTVRRTEGFAYDAFGRLTEIDHPDATKMTYSYDGDNNIAAVTDERHSAPNTMYTYDSANRLITTTQVLASAPGGHAVTAYGYDERGDLTSVTDPNGNLTSYVYDDFGQLLQQVSGVTGTTTYSYDAASNLVSTVDANGAATSKSYDALNRLVSSTSTLGSATETVTWTYDGGVPFGKGRLTAMSDPAGATTYAYERRGLLTREQRMMGGATYTTAYRYDGDGNRSAVVYPSARETDYVFDLAGHPVSASIAGGAVLVSSASYLPFGPITSIIFGNRTTKTMQYDSRYRVTENKLTGPSGTIGDYVYSQDAAGNITAIHDGVDATYDRSFTYDDLSRLTGAATGASLWQVGTYAYDAMGNMTTRSLGAAPVDDGTILSVRGRKRTRASAVSGYVDTISFAYQSTTPKLAAVTTNGLDHTVTYDAAGNETQYYASRTYSPRNELASVIDASDEVTQHRIDYGYDGRGVRVMRSESPVPAGAAHRYFFYTPELQLLATTVDDADNPWSPGSSSLATPLAMNAEIAWFAGLPIAEFGASRTPQDSQVLTVRGRRPRPASLAATTFYYTFTDHLGTPFLQTDSSGAIAWRVEYEPFGNVWKTRAGNSADQPLRFPGQELAMTWDGTEENYNIFRWYRSGWGRYTQSDPLGVKGDLNPYAYVMGNPLRLTDRLGRKCSANCPECPAGAWLFYGVNAGFLASIGSMSYGLSTGIFDAVCLSSGKKCTYWVTCSQGFGIGLTASVNASVGFAFNAKCSDDIGGVSFGATGNAYGPAGGAATGGISPTGAWQAGGSAGLGAGGGGAFQVCSASKVSCN
jgi:RHS repeat-associated protein